MLTNTITCIKQPNCCRCCFFHWVPSGAESTLENLRILGKKNMFITVSLQRLQHLTSTFRVLQLCCFLVQIDLFSSCALFSQLRSRDDTPENFSFNCCPTRHFHISYNAPYLPPKTLHKHCFQFLLRQL